MKYLKHLIIGELSFLVGSAFLVLAKFNSVGGAFAIFIILSIAYIYGLFVGVYSAGKDN
jgi:hypothetical protein